MADTGWTFVGTGASDSSFGTTAWSVPGNVTADDGSEAVAAFGGNTEYLKGTNLGLAIPSGDVIDGIEVRWERRIIVGVGPITTIRVRLVDETGTIGTTDRSSGDSWPNVVALQTEGSSTDLWGDTWSETDVEDVDFGFVVAASMPVGEAAAVDYMQMKVHHSPAAVVAGFIGDLAMMGAGR